MMKKTFTLALIFAILGAIMVARADTSKFVAIDARNRAGLTLVSTGLGSLTPFKAHPELTLRWDGIAGEDLGTQRSLAGTMWGIRYQTAFGFFGMIDYSIYQETGSARTSGLFIGIGSNF